MIRVCDPLAFPSSIPPTRRPDGGRGSGVFFRGEPALPCTMPRTAGHPRGLPVSFRVLPFQGVFPFFVPAASRPLAFPSSIPH